MKHIKNIINNLLDKGVKIALSEDQAQLKLRGNINNLSVDDKKELKLYKQELISTLKVSDKSLQSAENKVEKVGFQADYPISDAQRRLWITSQFKDGSSAYNIPTKVSLLGEHDVISFEKAILSVLERHEILRTVFIQNERGEIRQKILDVEDLNFKLKCNDLSNEHNKMELLDEYVKEDSVKTFDLEKGPLFRTLLFQLDENEYVFYYNMHHIISDGWSADVLGNDVMNYYKAYRSNTLPEIKDLSFQFKDYVSWQLKEMSKSTFDEDKQYWLDYLNGNLPLIDFPRYKNRPNIKTYNGRSLGTFLDADTSKLIDAYVEKNGGSTFMFLLSVFNVLAYFNTSSKDIITGTPVAGRDHLELKNQIGFYVNTVVIRNKINTEENFTSFYNSVKTNILNCLEHQNYPFDRLIEDLNVKRSKSRNPIFDIFFAYQDDSNIRNSDTIEIADQIIDYGNKSSKFDMQLNFKKVGEYISFETVFNSDVYEQEMIENLMIDFKYLTTELIHNSNQEISKIDLLKEEKKAQLLKDFNNTKYEFSSDKLYLDLFQDQVKKSPDSLAVVFEETSLSFKELDIKSNQLAHYLKDNHSINSNDIIGLKIDRNEWLIVSMLAVLKLGSTYVPLDLRYPKERENFIVQDTQLEVIIEDGLLEDFKNNISDYSIENLNREIKGDDLAYVIYTSGSTGTPKGVMVTHYNLLSFIQNFSIDFNFSNVTKFGATTNFTFDISVIELLGVLSQGITIDLFSSSLLIDPEKVIDRIVSENVDGIQFTPSRFSQLVSVSKGFLDNIQVALVGGEALNQELFTTLKEAPGTVIQVYGPTETTIWSTSSLIDEDSELTIGKPLKNESICILNEDLQLVPIGVVGEICIGGAGVAKGYLNRSELTREKFIDNPYSQGERLYRTGDLGRWLPDGNIEFIGRKDNQVKIRGHRIELGEIEYVLLQKQEVTQAVVLPVDDNRGETNLTAYLVCESNQNINDVRAYLSAKMPHYMIPSHFIQVEEIPLTLSGKIDRKALLNNGGVELATSQNYIAPKTENEIQIVNIWEEILQRDTIGLADDFFELGGHSLKALKLLNEYQKTFKVKLSIADVFEKSRLIEQLSLLINQSEKEDYIEIPKVEESTSYIVSDAQRRLWVLSQFEGGSVAYNMPSSIVLNEDVDIKSFEKAIYSVINRHEILRTIFKQDEEGEIRQIVKNTGDFNLEVVYKDFKDDPNQAELFIKQDSYKPFDLEKGPLLRAAMLQVSEDKFVFYYNMHHIISDGWSMEVLSKDVLAFYDAFKNNKEPGLSELSIQYKDYASWQLSQLETDSIKKSREFWIDNLSGELPVLDLPTHKKRPVKKTYKGSLLSTYLDKEATSFIKEYSKSNGGSLFTGLLTVLNVLLYRYTSERDIIIGTPVAARDHLDLKDQIGFYVNTLPLRNEINPEETFTSFYSRLKEATLTTFNHQMYPFDRLVEDLNLDRDTSRSALFDILLVLQNNGESVIDVTLNKEELNSLKYTEKVVSKFDLAFNFKELGDYLSFNVIYNSDVYEKGMVSQFISHFKQLIVSLKRNHNVAINELEYLSKEDKYELIEEFNTTNVVYPKDKTVLDLFTEQVNKNPEAVAVVYGDVELTYKELDERSNQLANYLIDKYSVEKEDLLGVKLIRNEKLIISILGILKSGGTYVPIDPNYPKDRIAYIERDTNCKVCIDEEELEKFSKIEGSITATDITIDLGDLAYVIYTSGSTGKPKGVMIEHEGLYNTIAFHKDIIGFTEKDKCLQFTNMSFDPSFLEIFITLSSGASVYIIEEKMKRDANLLAKYINSNSISIAFLPPVILPSFLIEDLKCLKALITGGEAIALDMAKHFSKEINYFNAYGPTESSIIATIFNGNIDDKVPIGKPISNINIYILDDKGNLQPNGVIGEICISGIGLARGYLNRSELTKDKFIANPFSKGKRLYKTGDLGRWLPDGNIEFIGRKDDQIKIRGHRIELGEIENAFSKIREVESNIVVVREKDQGNKELIAYFTGSDKLSFEYLQSELKEILPNYMIPSYFVQIDEFPVTSNGKIDKRNLPSPEQQGISSNIEYVAPRNKIEHELVSIWEEVLKREKIGIDDNFFELGGHSIKSIKLLNTIRKSFEKSIALEDIFSSTTIRELGLLISQSEKEDYIEIPKVEESTSYIVSDAQRRLWVLSQFEGGSVAYNMPSSIVLNEDVDIKSFEKAIYSVINRHEILRTIFKQDEEGEIRQIVKNTGDFNLEVVYKDFKDDPNQAELFIKQDSYKPFDLEKGPLLRAAMLQVSEDKFVFYYNMHHIISDGWSMEVLSKDVLAFYDAFKNNKEPGLSELSIQYKDYASWQLSQLETDSIKKSREFWIDNLSGELPVLDLPIHKKRPVKKTYKGSLLSTYLDKEATSFIKEYSKSNGGSLFTGLLTVLNVLLYRYTSERDIIIGTPVAARDHLDLKDQIGFYVNTLPLRNEINPEETFTSFYSRLKEATLTTFNHQMYPFDRLVEDLNLDRDTSRSALFDILLVLQNNGESVIDVTLNKEELNSLKYTEKVVAKFDVEFVFRELGDYLSFNVVYNSDIYDKDIISQFIQHFKQLMSSLQNNCDVPIGEIGYLSLEEKHELSEVFSVAEVVYPKDKTVLDLFSEQVDKNPEAIAVICEGIKLTYRELDRKSNQLAHYLIDIYSVEKEDLVSITLDRSEWMIISILGILKSGGAYVPIDPNYPEDRIAFIESETSCKVRVDKAELEKFKYFQYPSQPPELSLSSDNLAYVMYTSGSTGRPKGVEIEQKSIVRLVKNTNYIEVNKNDKFLGLSNFAFDGSTFDIYMPLLNGGSIVIAPKNIFLDLEELNKLLHTYEITAFFVTTVLFNNMVEAKLEGLKYLRYLLFGGELVSVSHVKEFKKYFPEVNLHHVYGPTENTTFSTFYHIKNVRDSESTIPIGSPIGNSTCYILDENLKEVPVGVAGEILVGGDGLARGYFKRSDLTIEKFIKHPFKEAERLYRTGDIGKWLPGGFIEFIGRSDNQVKIRGHRIELGEIENVLSKIKGIESNVVIVREKEEGERELIAYFIGNDKLSSEYLRNELKEILPDYMSPSYFVQIDAFPVTSNGKIDKKNLPSPEEYGISSTVEYVAPGNMIEQELVAIWEEVLKRDKIGIDDNFFELGGNSIKGIKIMSKLQKEFDVKINFGVLFKTPTIKNLSFEISKVISLREKSDSREIVDSTII
ncbi:amino acid adenylation domain-containing protein [Aquimarina rhabdastrellae]